MLHLVHPVYFPNVATTALLAQKECQWEVCDYYPKQTYRNRTYICTDQGKHLMSIPIKHVGGKQGKQYFRDVRTDNSYAWQRLHWRTLETAYRSSPFFEYFEDDLAPLFQEPPNFLLDFNLKCIDVVCALLALSVPEMKTKQYEPSPTAVADMRHLVNAKKNLPFDPPSYTQVFAEKHGFIPNVSVLDLLFNEGLHAADYLRSLPLNFAHA